MTTGGLPKYEKYRPARLSWLGEIPAHWEEKRAKFFFREVDERSATGEEELAFCLACDGCDAAQPEERHDVQGRVIRGS